MKKIYLCDRFGAYEGVVDNLGILPQAIIVAKVIPNEPVQHTVYFRHFMGIYRRNLQTILGNTSCITILDSKVKPYNEEKIRKDLT